MQVIKAGKSADKESRGLSRGAGTRYSRVQGRKAS